MITLDVETVHRILGATGWRDVLLNAGIEEHFLKNKHGPCPICGGKDRFRFDNKRGRGDYICSQCGAGDGFKLIVRAHGLSFKEAFKRVIGLAGLGGRYERPMQLPQSAPVVEGPSKPTKRVEMLLRESCAIEDCAPVLAYLARRELWPLPNNHGLRAHPSVEYWNDGASRGRHPALVAAVRNLGGELVTAHVTYLTYEGEKLPNVEPRKLLSAVKGHDSVAVPLWPPDGRVLGIAEGIETALSAGLVHHVPVWAALNTSLLQKFEPPQHIEKVLIFADRDVAGLDAATKLMQRLQERVKLEIKTPQTKDWNDYLVQKRKQPGSFVE